VIVHAHLRLRDDHRLFRAAKGGDATAALALAEELLAVGQIEQLRNLIGGGGAILLPVTALEDAGFNAIPDAMADILARALDWPRSAGDIVQINRVGHTRARAFNRMVAPAAFEGKVRGGEPERRPFLRTSRPALNLDFSAMAQTRVLVEAEGMDDKAGGPPFGMSPALPAFHRATRIAESLFSGAEASVVLIDGERVWRCGGTLVDSMPAMGVRNVIDRGRLLWADEIDRGPDLDPEPIPFRAHFWAGAPVRLADGATIGVLTVRGRAPRPYDKGLAGRLQDLADGIADECERARAAETAAERDRELRAARKVMSAFVGSVPIESVMTDRDLRVLTATPRWLEGFGLTEAEAAGRTLHEIAPEAFAHFRSRFERCLAGEVVNDARVRVAAEGKRKWMSLEMTPWRDDNGEIAGVVSAAQDVTETVAAMRSLERTQQRLQLATEMANLQVYDVDYRRRTIVSAGKALFPVGEAKDKAVAQAVFAGDTRRFIDPRDRERVDEASRRFHESGAPYEVEYRVLRDGGEEFWIAEVMQPMRGDDGTTHRIIGAMQDVTARKLTERALIEAKEDAEAATRAKSAFLATMSHEIRTPLNGVLGMAQAMAAAPLEPAQRERLDVIRQSGETLLTVLNDVLDLSKIEAGRLELEAAEFDIGAVAQGAHAAFAAIAAQKGLAFELTVSRAASGVYRGDSTRVRQVLNNLISNALKFTEAGRVAVRVGRRAGALTLTVADSGIGMSDVQQAALFQKFAQADASTTRRFGGTGLGLAICRELAELMGGRIEVKSAAGAGSTFVAILPLPRGERPARAAAPPVAALARTQAMPAAGAGLRLLAAEDNPMNQLVLKALLAQIGVEPVMVNDGVDAVAAWESGDWDLILMDVQMPRMDGPTATRFIRERELVQRRRRTPIVALTANAMTHQVNEYLAAGMDGFVAKPIEVERLFAALEAALAMPASRAAGAA
jgi:PAS domain S-box-containing protein